MADSMELYLPTENSASRFSRFAKLMPILVVNSSSVPRLQDREVASKPNPHPDVLHRDLDFPGETSFANYVSITGHPRSSSNPASVGNQLVADKLEHGTGYPQSRTLAVRSALERL